MPLCETVSLDRVKECLFYDPDTGHFTWLVYKGARAKPGDRAGTAHNKGYVSIIIDDVAILAHRLAWFYTYGEWPKEIDHINSDRSDNRLANLRKATKAQNAQNVAGFSTNRSGFKGVGLHNGRWRARIRANGRTHWLGHFPTKEDAYAAYCDAANRLHGEFARVA